MVEPEFTRVEFICCQKDKLWLTGDWLLWICNMFKLDSQKQNNYCRFFSPPMHMQSGLLSMLLTIVLAQPYSFHGFCGLKVNDKNYFRFFFHLILSE